MGTRRQQIKLPTDLVKELQTIKDLRHRHNWRKQFKNDYAVMELWEDRIREANEPIPEVDCEWEKMKYKRTKERLPEYEIKLKNIKERIAKYREKLKEYINGEQGDKYGCTLLF